MNLPYLERVDGGRMVVVMARDVGTGGNGGGLEPFEGLDLDIVAGTLTVLTPLERGRTAMRCLSGGLAATRGVVHRPTIDAEGAPDQRWVILSDRPHAVDPNGATGVAVLPLIAPGPAGPVGRPERDADTDTEPGALDALDALDAPAEARYGAVVESLTAALGSAPDVLGLDDPFAGLTAPRAADLLRRLQEFVVVQGRTLVVASDPAFLPQNRWSSSCRTVEVPPPGGFCYDR